MPRPSAGWSVEISGEPPQPADRAIALTIPPGQVELAVMFRAAGNVAAPVSHAIPMPRASRDKNKVAEGWLAPAICVKGQTCMVHGEFTGNSNKTFAAFGDRPGEDCCRDDDRGLRRHTGRHRRRAHVPGDCRRCEGNCLPHRSQLVARRARHAHPEAGRTIADVPLRIDGAEELPDAEWLPGNFPPSNLEDARKLVPGYRVPRARRKITRPKNGVRKQRNRAALLQRMTKVKAVRCCWWRR